MYKKYQFSAVEGTRRTRGEKEKKTSRVRQNTSRYYVGLRAA